MGTRSDTLQKKYAAYFRLLLHLTISLHVLILPRVRALLAASAGP